MKLRGTEPVESIDLSNKRLTELSTIIIASLIGSNTATKSLKYVAGSKRSLSCAVSSHCRLLLIPLTTASIPFSFAASATTAFAMAAR